MFYTKIFFYFILIVSTSALSVDNGNDFVGASFRVDNVVYFTTHSSQKKPTKINDFSVQAYDAKKNVILWQVGGSGYSYHVLANSNHEVFFLFHDGSRDYVIRKIDGKTGTLDPHWIFEVKRNPKEWPALRYIDTDGLPVYSLGTEDSFSLRKIIDPTSEKILPFSPHKALKKKFFVHKIFRMNSGKVLLTARGNNLQTPKSASDILFALIDANGKMVWEKLFTPYGEDYRDTLYAADIVDGNLYTQSTSQPIGDKIGIYKARVSKFNTETGNQIWSRDTLDGGRNFYPHEPGSILFSTYYSAEIIESKTGKSLKKLATSLYSLSGANLSQLVPLGKGDYLTMSSSARRHYSHKSNRDVILAKVNVKTEEVDDRKSIVIDGLRNRTGIRAFPAAAQATNLVGNKILFAGGTRFSGSIGGSSACCDRNLYTFDLNSEKWKRKRLFSLSDPFAQAFRLSEFHQAFYFKDSLYFWGADRFFLWGKTIPHGFKIDLKTHRKTVVKSAEQFRQRGVASPTVFVHKGKKKMFMYGGHIGRMHPKPPIAFKDGGLFDFETETWTHIFSKDLAEADMRNRPNILYIDGKVLVWGGWDHPYGGKLNQDGALYDIDSNSWIPISGKGGPTQRTIAKVLDGTAYFLEAKSLKLYTLNLDTLQWNSIDTAIPKPKFSSIQQLHPIPGGFFVVVTDWGKGTKHSIGRISADGASWIPAQDIPTDFVVDGLTGWASYVFHEDKLYIYGAARRAGDDTGTNHMLVLDLMTDRWDAVPVVF